MKQKNDVESRRTYGAIDLIRVRDGVHAGMIAAQISHAETENDEPIELSVPGFSGDETGGENEENPHSYRKV
jgi:hypothetical protein